MNLLHIENNWNKNYDDTTRSGRGHRNDDRRHMPSGIKGAIAQILTTSTEPQIRQLPSRNGEPSWLVYDPITQERHIFATEHDVRIWLEERYMH